ncbi:MAG: hypothetical protein M1814_006048 [Vezdaea aestivalis]|nr:MAG: hypothetical protein M1814_006048 [Vezdaea aestivalis]
MTTHANQNEESTYSKEEIVIRVEDYQNDKLQTYADLQNLDYLLSNVKEQEVLLRSQLEDAETELSQEQILVDNQNAAVFARAKAFQVEQEDIDRRIMLLTGSSLSKEAYLLFQTSLDKLQQLEIAQKYFSLLKQVDALSIEAKSLIAESPKAALKPYAQLQTILSNLKSSQNDAEGAAPHLIDHVEKSSTVLWTQMRNILEKEFQEVLGNLKWPSKSANIEAHQASWTENIDKLLEFQLPELRAALKEKDPGATLVPVLLPLEVMAKSLEARFRYHFDGDRPTNRLDKPEYFLSHIFDLLATYDPIFSTHLQPILSNTFSDTDLSSCPQYIDSTSALITSLLPMLRRKTFTYLPQISIQPQLLSHFIHEVISFDTTLRDEWGYTGRQTDETWNGLAWEILVQADWFNKWLSVEKDFALERYQSIVDSPDSGQIDFDSVDPDATKPTRGAVRVNDLLETITERYKPLSSFSQKLRFLIDIQIAIFDKFHNRLHSALEAYLAATSSVVRAVQGVSKEDQASVEGLAGLERLCRVYGSSEYLEKAMADWSDDVFFLELWDELTIRSSKETPKRLSGNLTATPLASRAAAAVDSSDALFDETASAFRNLRIRTEELLIEMIVGNAREALRPYSRLNPWATLSSSSSSASSTPNQPRDLDPVISQITVTAELTAPLEILASSLGYLRTTLATPALRRITRQICLALQTWLWDYVLMRNGFSSAGATQLATDTRALWTVVDSAVGADGSGIAESGMARLSEGLRLLGLGDGEGEEELQGVGRELFRNNEAAREVLGRLGMVLLGESEARGVLEKRIELAA